MKSITNKIALMLIVALCISFVAMSAASYYTAQNKTIELVIQSQRQILKDVKNAMNTFFDENTHAANGIAQRLEKLEDRSQINEILSTGKLIVSPEIERIFVGYESDGAMYRSNGKNEMPKDNGYDPRTRDWYKIAKGAKATFSDPYKSSSSNAMMIAFSAPIGNKGVAAMNLIFQASVKRS